MQKDLAQCNSSRLELLLMEDTVVTVGSRAKDSARVARLGLRAVSYTSQAVDSLNGREIRGGPTQYSKGGPDASRELKKRERFWAALARTFAPIS